MVGWKRHLQLLKFCHHLRPSSLLVPSEFSYLQSLGTQPSLNISRPFCQYFQHLRFSSTRNLLADSSNATPIPSPLTPVLAIESGKVEDQKVVSKPSKVQAVLKVRGMRVEDALLQLQVAIKRAAKTVYQVINSASANATHNHGLDPDRLLVAEAHVGKGLFKKRINYHAKGKCGMKVRPECRLTVVVREITAEKEAEIAKLKVHNFRKLSKRERRLLPHKLIETTPVWGRKSTGREPAGMAS